MKTTDKKFNPKVSITFPILVNPQSIIGNLGGFHHNITMFILSAIAPAVIAFCILICIYQLTKV